MSTIIIEIFTTNKGKEFVWYPLLIKMTLHTHTSKKFCMFHWNKEYDIEQCFALR